jgi:hypothetical protein
MSKLNRLKHRPDLFLTIFGTSTRNDHPVLYVILSNRITQQHNDRYFSDVWTTINTTMLSSLNTYWPKEMGHETE